MTLNLLTLHRSHHGLTVLEAIIQLYMKKLVRIPSCFIRHYSISIVFRSNLFGNHRLSIGFGLILGNSLWDGWWSGILVKKYRTWKRNKWSAVCNRHTQQNLVRSFVLKKRKSCVKRRTARTVSCLWHVLPGGGGPQSCLGKGRATLSEVSLFRTGVPLPPKQDLEQDFGQDQWQD